MTGKELFDARATLGRMWGYDRPIGPNELARALRLGKNGAGSILKMEAGERPVSGPMSVAIEAMLAGFRPQDKGEITANPPAD